jgi:23S rRNA pseudouridine1911/1915/1917 synthase
MQTPQTILTRLAALFPQAKKTTLRDMVASKRVRLNGTPVKSLKEPVTDADKFEVTDLSAAPTKPTTLANGLKLVFMDSSIIIIDKPAGLLTATDPSEKRPTVLKILTDYFQKPNAKNQVHLIHRLDKDASGLLVLARSTTALNALKEQFFEHTIIRRYDVLVHGVPTKKEGRLENLLLEDERTGIVRTTTDQKTGKLAILDYVTIQTDSAKKIAHLQCTLYTGRKHQIRIQLKHLGHPVLGDPIYGSPPKPEEPPGRLALHASHLTFKHPGTHRKVSFDSQMPGSFAHLLHN